MGDKKSKSKGGEGNNSVNSGSVDDAIQESMELESVLDHSVRSHKSLKSHGSSVAVHQSATGEYGKLDSPGLVKHQTYLHASIEKQSPYTHAFPISRWIYRPRRYPNV